MLNSKKEFARYSFLSVLGQLGISCYILADTFFISKGLGTNGLAALNLAIPVYNFIYGTGLMLGLGGATKFVVFKSRNEEVKVHQSYTTAVIVSLIFSLIFMISGLFFSSELAILMGADENVFEMTEVYLRWMLSFAPAYILNAVLQCFVRNDGAPRLSMIAMLVGSFSNIILDYIFIFPMNLGMFGAVLATCLAPIISMAVMLPHWIKRNNTFKFVIFKTDFRLIKEELSLGFPSLVAQFSTGIVIIVFNILILNLEGNVGVAAYGVIANISLVVLAIYTGLAQGVQPLISRSYGVNDNIMTVNYLKYANITSIILSIIMYIGIFIWADPITSIFNSENEQMLQSIAITGLIVYFTSNVFVGFNLNISTFFTSIETPMPAHVLSLLRGFFVIIPMAFILSYAFKMLGIWLAYPITEALVAILGIILYYKHKKMRGI